MHAFWVGRVAPTQVLIPIHMGFKKKNKYDLSCHACGVWVCCRRCRQPFTTWRRGSALWCQCGVLECLGCRDWLRQDGNRPPACRRCGGLLACPCCAGVLDVWPAHVLDLYRQRGWSLPKGRDGRWWLAPPRFHQ